MEESVAGDDRLVAAVIDQPADRLVDADCFELMREATDGKLRYG